MAQFTRSANAGPARAVRAPQPQLYQAIDVWHPRWSGRRAPFRGSVPTRPALRRGHRLDGAPHVEHRHGVLEPRALLVLARGGRPAVPRAPPPASPNCPRRGATRPARLPPPLAPPSARWSADDLGAVSAGSGWRRPVTRATPRTREIDAAPWPATVTASPATASSRGWRGRWCATSARKAPRPGQGTTHGHPPRPAPHPRRPARPSPPASSSASRWTAPPRGPAPCALHRPDAPTYPNPAAPGACMRAPTGLSALAHGRWW
jgi:hypothetical protein